MATSATSAASIAARILFLAGAIVSAFAAVAPAASVARERGFVEAPAAEDAQDGGGPFSGNAQYIWMVNRSGGTAQRISRAARKHGISTVFVKAGDGSSYWTQFDGVLDGLKAKGVRVCAWQFVYGRNPALEAKVAARAVRRGADCFIVDAESHLEGRYTAARQYMRALRRSIGPHYPVALSSFPYVDYHPSFPYSAFFEPPYAAQYNLPQTYWRAIGHSVSTTLERTFRWNAIYGRPIAPTAGTWLGETPAELRQFRSLAAVKGAPGVSYWAWQFTAPIQWQALGAPFPTRRIASIQGASFARLDRKSKGDPVVWLQIQLRKWGHRVRRTGYFDGKTKAAVLDFQTAAALPPTGTVDDATWRLLLSAPPDGSAEAGAAGGAADPGFAQPRSSRLPAKAYEIAPNGGAGVPSGR